MPSIPGLPLLAFTRRKARRQFSRPQTSSISCSALAGLSVSQFAVSDSVPSRRAFGASLLPSTAKASTICSWFFCRLSLIESCVLLAAPYCSGLRPHRPTMPSADSRCTVRMDRSILSHDSVTCCGSPEVSSTAFRAQPPIYHQCTWWIWASRSFARSPCTVGLIIRFLFIGSRLSSTLLSDPASPRRPCASLVLHLHQVGQGTFTPKLSNMFGTQKKSRSIPAALSSSSSACLLTVCLIALNAPADPVFTLVQITLLGFCEMAIVFRHVGLFLTLQRRLAPFQVRGLFRVQAAVRYALRDALLLALFTAIHFVHARMSR